VFFSCNDRITKLHGKPHKCAFSVALGPFCVPSVLISFSQKGKSNTPKTVCAFTDMFD
jgi:hypothetical protein